MRTQRSIDDLVREAAHGQGAGRTRAAARLMTLLESEPRRLPELFRGVPVDAWPQPRAVVGITGAPGSGKSTLTDQLVAEYRHRFPERRVGVVAVDPSSPFTGGSVLGDRVRMMRHATDPQVFIRSLAARGHLGGLALGVRGVLRVMGLIGCDTVILETVGVGQSEVEVARVADLVLVVLAPGQGDSVQMLKAGLMEVGDAFVVNKADQEGASALHAELLSALRLAQAAGSEHRAAAEGGTDPELVEAAAGRRRSGTPEVFLVSATSRQGVPELLAGLERRAEAAHPEWRRRRDDAVRDEVREAVLQEARLRLLQAADAAATDAAPSDELRRVLRGEATVAGIAQEWLERAAAAGRRRDTSS